MFGGEPLIGTLHHGNPRKRQRRAFGCDQWEPKRDFSILRRRGARGDRRRENEMMALIFRPNLIRSISLDRLAIDLNCHTMPDNRVGRISYLDAQIPTLASINW